MARERLFWGIIIFFLSAVICTATDEVDMEVPDSSVVMHFKIHYPVNDTDIHPEYMDNAKMLHIINEHLHKSRRIDSIVIYSSASPEGPYSLNKRLAIERGKKARNYITSHIPSDRHIPDSVITIKPTTENWEGLRELVESEYPYEDKEDVLNLLCRKDISDEYRKSQLKRINNGRPWEYIRSHLLPQLRYASWIAVWVKVLSLPDIPDEISALACAPAEKPLRKLPPPVETCRQTVVAIKSNLLYDVASLLNYSIEVPIYKDRLSMLLYHQFPWWNWGPYDNEMCIRFMSLGTEARWWFPQNTIRPEGRRRDRLTGHFIGLYGESGKYDFQFKREICYQGEFWSAGLSYGYSMPLGKTLNMEFSLSVGYASIPYRGYIPSETYEYLWRDMSRVGRLHYFGPTKAQISLVIPITAKIRKGGER